MTKEEKKLAEPTAEEKYLSSIVGIPLDQWEDGKEFVVSDQRASVVLLPIGGAPSASELTGDTVRYTGRSEVTALDGRREERIIFSHGADRYEYHFSGAGSSASGLVSDRLPMLIDLSMIEAARRLMIGKRFYILSPNWENESGERIAGRKYVEAEIAEVSPGSMVFPAKVKFTASDGSNGYYMMNLGGADRDSRAFATLFSLTDPHLRYPQINDETWGLIRKGEVRKGMTKEECRLSLGAPGEVDTGRDYSHTLDLWQYPDGTIIFFEDGVVARTRISGNITNRE